MTLDVGEPKGHCYGKNGDCSSGCFGINCSCSCDGCMEQWKFKVDQPSLPTGPDPLFTFSDAVLKNALEAAWLFLEKRGARESRYEKSVERMLPLYFLGYKGEPPKDVRMLRTTGDWQNSAWEIEDGGFLFEIDGGKVTSPRIKNPEKAKEECYKMLLSMMAISGTKADYDQSVSKRPR